VDTWLDKGSESLLRSLARLEKHKY
jgi:hypothetical protein